MIDSVTGEMFIQARSQKETKAIEKADKLAHGRARHGTEDGRVRQTGKRRRAYVRASRALIWALSKSISGRQDAGLCPGWGSERSEAAFELGHGGWPQLSDSLSPFTRWPLSPAEWRHGALG